MSTRSLWRSTVTAVVLTLSAALPTWADNDEAADAAREEMLRVAERWAYEALPDDVPSRETTKPALAFARHFHRHVATPLRRTAWLHAVYVSHGMETWGEAHTGVMRFGRQHGAGYLSDDYQRDLADAVAEQLVTFIAEHDAQCPATGGCTAAYPGDAP